MIMKISEENKYFNQESFNKIKSLLMKNLQSTTQSIQIYCINTIANLDLNVKNYRKLLEKISNVLHLLKFRTPLLLKISITLTC